MKKMFLALVALAALVIPGVASAEYWVTASASALGPVRNGQDVQWASGDTKLVSEEVIDWYNANSGVFTVTEVQVTGAEMNELDGLGLGTVSTGLTAQADGTQGNATALATGFNNVTTSAGALDSVKLPAAAAGNVVWVKNSGANSIAVFPATSDSIDALAINLAVTVDPSSVARFVAKDAIVWESNVDNSMTLNAPTTAKGQMRILAADNAADYTFTLTNASHGQDTVVTVPDVGLATSYVVQSTAAVTAAEANVLDGAVAGTQAASKAVVADANVNIGTTKVTALHIGATGTETEITATGAELNMAADISSRVEEVSAANVITSAECGRTFILNSATEFASTLPAVTGTGGCEFRFIVRAAPSGASYTIAAAAETTAIIGSVNEIAVTNAGPTCVAADGCDVVTFVDGTAVDGDMVHLISDGTNWYIEGHAKVDGGVTIADTP